MGRGGREEIGRERGEREGRDREKIRRKLRIELERAERGE